MERSSPGEPSFVRCFVGLLTGQGTRVAQAVSIPDYQTLMRPLLALHDAGATLSQAELRELLAEEFELSEEDLDELLPSGTQKTFHNRVGWATTYLVRAGLLDRPQRAHADHRARTPGPLPAP